MYVLSVGEGETIRGTLLLFKPREMRPTVQRITAAPTVRRLRRMVGGFVELVPEFDIIEYEGEVHRCVALCKHGKHEGLNMNVYATVLWNRARRRKGHPPNPDFLAGPVVIVFSYRALIEASLKRPRSNGARM
jgi:hypothetical protein